MSRVFNEMIAGFGTLVSAYTQPRSYQAPCRSGFSRDSAALAGDVRVIGSDLSKATASYEQSANIYQRNVKKR